MAPAKLPYERTDEENKDIMAAEVKAHFEPKRPPPKEIIDPVKVKRSLDALRRPPPPPPQSHYDRCIEKTFDEARRSGSTTSAARRSEKTIPQLGE
jgi:hypothetical protein